MSVKLSGAACSVQECCSAPASGRWGFCGAHYQRQRKYGDPRAGKGFAPGVPLAFRLTALSDQSSGPNACWLWLGTKSEKGYGLLWWRGRTVRVTHVAYEQHYGHPVPSDKPIIRHTCDHPWCVNARHLRAGTQADNIHDMMRKGRDARPHGEDHHHAKLTEAHVRKIREDYALGRLPQQQLAAHYGVNQSVISDIILRRGWAHVA